MAQDCLERLYVASGLFASLPLSPYVSGSRMPLRYAILTPSGASSKIVSLGSWGSKVNRLENLVRVHLLYWINSVKPKPSKPKLTPRRWGSIPRLTNFSLDTADFAPAPAATAEHPLGAAIPGTFRVLIYGQRRSGRLAQEAAVLDT